MALGTPVTTWTISSPSPVCLRARPETRRAASPSRPQRIAALVLTPVTTPQAPPVELVQSLFDLTPAEACVARSLAAGDTVEAIATSRRVSQNTIRAHVRDILKKTGCNRQADMIALLIRETARPRQLVETERVEAYKTSARL
jgi:DNA-binding CsgD family transcriptional regulator